MCGLSSGASRTVRRANEATAVPGRDGCKRAGSRKFRQTARKAAAFTEGSASSRRQRAMRFLLALQHYYGLANSLPRRPSPTVQDGRPRLTDAWIFERKSGWIDREVWRPARTEPAARSWERSDQGGSSTIV